LADPSDQELLLSFLRGRDVECPLCRYNLRDLSSPRCPECGRELRLTVGMLQPYMSAWVTLAITLCASGAIGLLFLLLVIRNGLPAWDAEHRTALNVAYWFHVAMIPLALAAVIWRRRFMRVARREQWFAAILALVACALMFTGFAMLVT
jgi:hypothetical protein